MVERSRSRRLARQATAREVVAGCKAYSVRLKETPLPVQLHTSPGTTAKGTVKLETDQSGLEQLVVQAEGSQLFGLVRLSHRHVFKVGELERSQSTHTAFLARSVRLITKGNEHAKENMLLRSLSLIHKREAVDITCDTKEHCEQLAMWIDARWSVAMIKKSFRGNPRIALALQGRNQTLNDRGLYEALEKVHDEELQGEGSDGDAAAYGVLPKLDDATLTRLQDDLLNGVHVTYHDLALGGYYSRSSPRRLRYDCESEAGLVYLEASYEEGGQTIVQKVSDLLQVGGGPSVHGPTAGLLRATQGKPAQREAAVSLVFRDMSLDITCGTKQDAWELVLYFSAVGGFRLARTTPRIRKVYQLPPVKRTTPDTAVKARAERPSPGVITEEMMGAHRKSPVAPSAVVTSASKAEACHSKGVANLDSPPPQHRVQQPDPLAPTFSTRFRAGLEALGKDHATQVSASSGFGLDLTRSVSESSSVGGSARDRPGKESSRPEVQQRSWPTPANRRNGRGGGGGRGPRTVPSAPPQRSAFSPMGPLPDTLRETRGKKGRSVTPQPERKPTRRKDSSAAGNRHSTPRYGKDVLVVAASAGGPSSGAGRGGGESQTPTGAGFGTSRSPRAWNSPLHLGRPRGETTFEPQRRLVEGKRDPLPVAAHSAATAALSQRHDSPLDRYRKDAPLNRRNLFKSTPTSDSKNISETGPAKGADGSRAAARGFGSAPGDQSKVAPPPTSATGSSRHRDGRSHGEGGRGELDHLPQNRRRVWVGGEGPEDYTKQTTRRTATKELPGPLREGMRHVGHTVVSPAKDRERRQRSAVGDTVGGTTSPTGHVVPLSPRDAGRLFVPSSGAVPRASSPHRQQHREPKASFPPKGGHGVVESDGLEEDRCRTRSTPVHGVAPEATDTSIVTRSVSPTPRGVVVPFSSHQEVIYSAQEAAELETPIGNAAGDERLQGGARLRFGGIERTERVDQAESPLSHSPKDGQRPRRSPGGGRPHAGREDGELGLEDDENFTTFRVKEASATAEDAAYGSGARRQSHDHPAGQTTSPDSREGGRRKALRSFLRGGGEKLKNFASGGGVHRREGGAAERSGRGVHRKEGGAAERSGEAEASQTHTSGSGRHRRQHRNTTRFFSNPRAAVSNAVESFATSESKSPGRHERSRSPTR